MMTCSKRKTHSNILKIYPDNEKRGKATASVHHSYVNISYQYTTNLEVRAKVQPLLSEPVDARQQRGGQGIHLPRRDPGLLGLGVLFF